MTPTEARLLAALPRNKWVAPKDVQIPAAYINGLDNTHLVALRRMVPKGWVETAPRAETTGLAHKRRSEPTKPKNTYRITKAGAQALANHMALSGAVRRKR